MNRYSKFVKYQLEILSYEIFLFVIWANLLSNLDEIDLQIRPNWQPISPKLMDGIIISVNNISNN